MFLLRRQGTKEGDFSIIAMIEYHTATFKTRSIMSQEEEEMQPENQLTASQKEEEKQVEETEMNNDSSADQQHDENGNDSIFAAIKTSNHQSNNRNFRKNRKKSSNGNDDDDDDDDDDVDDNGSPQNQRQQQEVSVVADTPSSASNSHHEHPISSDTTSTSATTYYNSYILSQYSNLILLLSFCILVYGYTTHSLTKLLTLTDSTVHPIPDTPSYEAIRRFRSAFGGSGNLHGHGHDSVDMTSSAVLSSLTDDNTAAASGFGLRHDDPLNPGVILLLQHNAENDHANDHENGRHDQSNDHDIDIDSDMIHNNNGNNETFVDGVSPLYQYTKNFTFGLQTYISSHLPLALSTACTSRKAALSSSSPSIIQPMTEITSFYSLQNEKLYSASQSLVADNGNVVMLYIRYSIPSCLYSSSSSTTHSIQRNIQKSYSTSILSSIQSYTDEHYIQPLTGRNSVPLLHPQQQQQQQQQYQPTYKLSIGYTGILPFQNDLSSTIHQDIHYIHLFILPLSLFLLCLALSGHYTILFIPILSISCVCTLWSITLYALLQFNIIDCQLTQFTPQVMIVVSIGLGLDYTLFLLSRLFHELQLLRNETFCEFQRKRMEERRKMYHHHTSMMNNSMSSSGGRNVSLNESVYSYTNSNERDGSGDGYGFLLLDGSEEGINHESSNEETNSNHNKNVDKDDEEEDVFRTKVKTIAIRNMIQYSGHTIFMSGITLMITFLGLSLFPIHALQSVSIGATVAIIMCLVVNLTVVPAFLHSKLGYKLMLLSRPESGGTGMEVMFMNAKTLLASLKKRYRLWKYKSRTRLDSGPSRNNLLYSLLPKNESMNDDTINDNNDALNGTGLNDDIDVDGINDSYTCFEDLLLEREFSNENSNATLKHSNVTRFEEGGLNLEDSWASDVVGAVETPEIFGGGDEIDATSFWFKLAKIMIHPTKSLFVLGAILVVSLPIAFQCQKMKTSISFELMIPSNSPSMKTFNQLGNLFGQGKLSPYRILFDGLDFGDKINTPDGFDVMHNVIQKLEEQINNDDGQSIAAHCTGIAWYNGASISYTSYTAAMACSLFSSCPFESSRELIKLDSMSTSNDEFSTTVTCTLDNDSFSDSAVEWLGHSRLLLDYMNGSAAMKNYTVSLLGGSSIEADAKIAVEDGLGMMIAATMICVFVVTALFLRSVMAPLRSVISILLTLITVYGMDVIVCQGSAGSLSWLTVPMSFSIIVGLGLDYDMFLINRVIEYRIAGYDHHSSIVGGLAQTGKTITAAGVIMAASFGGLLFSSSPIASQWSFSLTAAVLIDTFVMRSCVVPILMAKTGQYSWYPRELPESSLTLFPGQNDDHVLL